MLLIGHQPYKNCHGECLRHIRYWRHYGSIGSLCVYKMKCFIVAAILPRFASSSASKSVRTHVPTIKWKSSTTSIIYEFRLHRSNVRWYDDFSQRNACINFASFFLAQDFPTFLLWNQGCAKRTIGMMFTSVGILTQNRYVKNDFPA